MERTRFYVHPQRTFLWLYRRRASFVNPFSYSSPYPLTHSAGMFLIIKKTAIFGYSNILEFKSCKNASKSFHNPTATQLFYVFSWRDMKANRRSFDVVTGESRISRSNMVNSYFRSESRLVGKTSRHRKRFKPDLNRGSKLRKDESRIAVCQLHFQHSSWRLYVERRLDSDKTRKWAVLKNSSSFDFVKYAYFVFSKETESKILVKFTKTTKSKSGEIATDTIFI